MNIYWKDVREQKATLQELIAGAPVGSRTSEHMIDGVQDKAVEGKCAKCGSTDFTLAEDFTEYSTCTFEDGEVLDIVALYRVEARLKFWRELNDYAISQRGESARSGFEVTQEVPDIVALAPIIETFGAKK